MVQFINTTTKDYTRQELLCCTDDLIAAYLHDFKLPNSTETVCRPLFISK